MQNNSLKSYIHLHFIVFIWGFTAVLGQLITLDALPLVWWRMLIASTIILLFLYYRKISLKVPPKTLIGFLFAGLIIALHWFTFFKAIKVSNVSVTLACIATGAFFTSILEPLLFGKKVVWYEIFLGILVVLGLGIIFKVETQYLEGIILALLSALLSATFAIINGKYAKEFNASVITFYELIGGALFLSIFIGISDGFSPAFFALSGSDLLWLFILASVCTAYAFIASVKVMKYLTPYTVMLTINLEPIYGTILALLVFPTAEKMSPNFYIGASIILSTVLLNGYLKTKIKR